MNLFKELYYGHKNKKFAEKAAVKKYVISELEPGDTLFFIHTSPREDMRTFATLIGEVVAVSQYEKVVVIAQAGHIGIRAIRLADVVVFDIKKADKPAPVVVNKPKRTRVRKAKVTVEIKPPVKAQVKPVEKTAN